MPREVLAGPLAGTMKMRYPAFLAANATGAVLWAGGTVALIYLLGGDLTGKPTYTTLFLDEALIKADGRYTKRALTVLPRLGFQIIVSAPESKTAEILSIADKAYVAYKDPATGNSYLQELDREPATQAETQDATVEQTQPATEA